MVFRCKKCGKFLFEVKSPNKITSVEVAKMFDKRHTHVMEDIRRLNCPQSDSEKNVLDGPNFRLISYKDSIGRKKPCYEMTRAGFRVLAARYKATQLRTSPDKVSPMEVAEIKDGKRYTKIYGSDRIEVKCGRCGTINIF